VADPYQKFGRTAADAILRETARMPADARTPFLRAALGALNSRLYDKVAARARAAVAAGAQPAPALRSALSSSLAEGLLQKTIQTGLTSSGYQDLGLWGVSWGDVGKVGGGILFPPSLLVTTSTGRNITSKVLSTVQDAACKLTSSGVGQLAAAGGAAYAGAPPAAGAQGAQAISSLTCPPPAVVPFLNVPAQSLLVPALIAGGLVLVAVVASR
jgi:hypothetical protein